MTWAEIGAVPTTVNQKKIKVGEGGTWPTGGQVLSDKEGEEVYLNPPHIVGRIRPYLR